MSASQPIIFIDDEEHIRLANRQTLELAGYAVTCLETAEAALPRITDDWPGVVVSDIRLPGMDGMALLDRLRAVDPDLPVILITGHGDIAMAVQAIRAGAYDFIEKPFAAETLTEVVRRAFEKRALTLENRELRQELEAERHPGPRIIGSTPVMQRLRATIAHIADTDADVLVLGETGTGKELVARSLHELSGRRTRNFVPINCGAIPDNLIESELFGHEAGAFTDARERRIGKFEHASGGTLFLDEIESMPLTLQVRMLRVLQERVVERLGGNEPIAVNLRVVAATKADLRRAGDEGRFREDLYYRLNVVTIEIPPLRDRREDIPLLLHHFLLVAGARYGREVQAPAGEHLAALMAYDWPGNVRELRNLAERYLLLGESCGYDLTALLHGAPTDAGPMTLPEQVECFERQLIEQALAASRGRLKDVMDRLRIPRKTLYDKMRRHGLDKADYRDA